MNRPNKELIPNYTQPNIDEIGQLKKIKRTCYYCNTKIVGEYRILPHKNKDRFIHPSCDQN
jgi:hypothetical protein